MTTESRQDRVARLKRKFLALSKIKRIIEFVRYDRAAKGQLPHQFPDEYVEECRDALWELLIEDYERDEKRLRKLVGFAARRPSEPFLKLRVDTGGT